MSKKITTSIESPTGNSYTNMIMDVDNAYINIGVEETDGLVEHVLKAKIKVYTSQANLDTGKKESFIEKLTFRTENIKDVQKNPYGIIESELGKKYTLA